MFDYVSAILILSIFSRLVQKLDKKQIFDLKKLNDFLIISFKYEFYPNPSNKIHGYV